MMATDSGEKMASRLFMFSFLLYFRILLESASEPFPAACCGGCEHGRTVYSS
jgi:hypothetical protein